MIDVNQLRRGTNFTIDGELFKVSEYGHRKPGRGKATIRVTVKNMRTGSNTQMTFTSGDRVQDIRLDKSEVQYLYDDGQFFVFMDQTTYEQSFINKDVMGQDSLYLKEGLELQLLKYDEEVLDYILPITIDFEVVDSEMAVAGDTVSGATKIVITSTGLKVKTPLFVTPGNIIKVNTESGAYVTRV